jgi:hypothetical protein
MDAPFGFNMPRARDRGAFGCLSLQSIHLHMQFNMLFESCRLLDFFVGGPRAQSVFYNELMMLAGADFYFTRAFYEH